jgi:hypothetical protein
MPTRARPVWKRHPLLALAFALAVVATVFFAARAVSFAITLHWRSEQPVASWMTPRYIARTYGIDRADLARLLGTADTDDLRLPLFTIAQQRDIPTADLLATVQAVIDAQDAGE